MTGKTTDFWEMSKKQERIFWEIEGREILYLPKGRGSGRMEAMQREKIFLFFCSYVIMSLIENGRMEWCEMLELKRMVYEDLMKWKVSNTGKVLEVNGARQVGKTYILDKFAKENYRQYLYINMTQTSGKEFLQCLEAATAWKPGEKRNEKPLHRALMLFQPDFRDEKTTVVVIDEIQDSAEVFSKIREFSKNFICDFIVTGSYLGQTLNKEYFLPAGDIDVLAMDTLSYEEFLDAVGKRSLYQEISMYGEGKPEDYEELKHWYEIYLSIGGYPAVVKCYLETGDMEQCMVELGNIIRIFIDESERYFKDVLEMNLFEQIFPAIAQSMVREKKGSSDLVTELFSIIFKEESNKQTKKSINQAVAWLYRSNVIGYCSKVNECNILDVTYNSRFYLRDIGIARYFLRMIGADQQIIQGIVNENFVSLYLERLVRKHKIAGTTPAFGVYKQGEIDFFVRGLKTYQDYAIEVKAGKNIGKTANQILEDGKADVVYLLKGDTYGGIADKKITVPIYLTGRIEFA